MLDGAVNKRNLSTGETGELQLDTWAPKARGLCAISINARITAARKLVVEAFVPGVTATNLGAPKT